jgi:hypothetical protein
MAYRFLADLVLVLHLAFVLFVALGGLLVLRWRRAAWVHLPAAAWGAVVMFTGWICPLTPFENELRGWGGEAGYQGGFVEHYVVSVLYPAGLTRGIQVALGLGVILLNVAVYRRVLATRRQGVSGRGR